MITFIYKEIFLPTTVVAMLRMFITVKEMGVAGMIIICQTWTLRKISLKGIEGIEKNNEPQTDDEQNSYEDSVKLTSPLKIVDMDETFVLSSVVGKNILHKKKLTLLDKLSCQPSKAVLS